MMHLNNLWHLNVLNFVVTHFLFFLGMAVPRPKHCTKAA